MTRAHAGGPVFGFVQDLRYALRTLLQSQGFTIVAVLTLALGIGANVATFGVVYSVLLRPLPFPHAEQLVRVFDDLRGPNEQDVGMSAPELWDLQDRSGVFQNVSAVAPSSSAVGGGDRTVRAESLVTSPDYFVLLGTKPELGRVYTPEDAAPGFMEPVVISALGQFAPVNAVVFLRSRNDAEHLGEAVRHEVESVDPNVPVHSISSMDQIIARSLAGRLFALELLAVFAAVALILAAIGIYGVMSYSFSQRTHEVGIRVALGAQRLDILRMALGEGMRIVVVGLAAGLVGAAIVTRVFRSMLFEVTPSDPATFVSVAAILAAVAFFACFIPARRATRVDPLVALREE